MTLKYELAKVLGRLWATNFPPKSFWPRFIEKRAKPYGLNYRAEAPFRSSTMLWDERGFWYLHPMPSPDQLTHYYNTIYWTHFRRGFGDPVNHRDVNHADLLISHIPELATDHLSFINFGAGHGGLSHLMAFAGHDVTEVDPGKTPYVSMGRKISVVKSLGDLSLPVDVIYASHALEHVSDVTEFFSEVRRLLKSGGHLFIEVPNGLYGECGPQKGVIDVPHTYYFTRAFFSDLEGFYAIRNVTCHEGAGLAVAKHDSGSAIQYLGRAIQ